MRFANFEGMLAFSVQSMILADLLGNKGLLARVQKVMVCDSRLVDFDAFCLFRVLRFVVLKRLAPLAKRSTCRKSRFVAL